jgi:hypothetical protein
MRALAAAAGWVRWRAPQAVGDLASERVPDAQVRQLVCPHDIGPELSLERPARPHLSHSKIFSDPLEIGRCWVLHCTGML